MINLNGVCIFTQRGNFMEIPSLLIQMKAQNGTTYYHRPILITLYNS